MAGRGRRLAIVASLAALLAWPSLAAAQDSAATIAIRGKPQSLRLYGTRGGQAVVVSSGDGGWIHLAPHVAEALSRRGFFVVGFDAKAYLSSFTTKDSGLSEADVTADYRALAEFAAQGSRSLPILIGVSEGAGLSVLAASGDAVKQRVLGVIGIGLPEKNELGWRWRDMAIYITHGVPNEPLFNASAVVGRVSPTPLAAIHSTADEFVPLETLKAVFEKANEPKRLWTVKASNHRFSDNLRDFDQALADAIAWIVAVRRVP
jgi:alpha-beta hydrolase superfamily lysophospholipase